MNNEKIILGIYVSYKCNIQAHALSVTGMEGAREKDRSETLMQEPPTAGMQQIIRKRTSRKNALKELFA